MRTLFFLARTNRLTIFQVGLLMSSGFTLGLTRLTGFLIPSMTFIIIVLYSFREPIQIMRSAAALWALSAVSGLVAFLGYCQLSFGAWDTYFTTVRQVWNKNPDPWNFAQLFGVGTLKAPFWFAFITEPMTISIIVNSVLLLWFAVHLMLIFRPPSHSRILGNAILVGAFAHLLVTTYADSGTYHNWGNGMRYSAPVFFVAAALGDLRIFSRFDPSIDVRVRRAKTIYLVLATIFLVVMQLIFMKKFVTGRWVS